MPTPESGPSPNGAPSFESARELLEATRKEVASERTEAIEGASRNAEASIDPDKPSLAERRLLHDETRAVIGGIALDRQESGRYTKEQLLHRVADRVIKARLLRADQDVEALEKRERQKAEAAAETDKDKKDWQEKHPVRSSLSRFVDKYRHDKKWRIGIAVGSTAAAGALAATGLWLPAAAVKVGSGILRGTAGYVGTKEAIHSYAEKRIDRQAQTAERAYRQEIKVPDMDAEQMELEAQKIVQRDPNETLRILAMMESPSVRAQRSSEEAHNKAQRWTAALHAAQREYLVEQFRTALEGSGEVKKVYFKRDMPERLREVVASSLADSMTARRQQVQREIEHGHRILSREQQLARWDKYGKMAAILVGSGLAASGFAGLVTNVAEHAQHVRSGKDVLHGLGRSVTGVGHELGSSLAPHEHVHHLVETFSDHVTSGDTVWGHIGKHMEQLYNQQHGHAAWGRLTDLQRNIRIDHAVDLMSQNPSQYVPSGNLDLIHPGETIHLPRKILEAGLNFK